jgi:phosphate transport system permease protein
VSTITETSVGPDGRGTGRGLKPSAGSDRPYRFVLWAVSAVMAVVLIAFVFSIVKNSIPGWQVAGWSFFTSKYWDFGSNQFGVIPLVLGTLFTTIVAVLVASPIAIGTALAVVFLVPRRLKTPVSALVEVLAVVPSIIYGVWGALVLDGWLGGHAQPWLANLFHHKWPFSGTPVGYGMMLGSIVLAVMILPTVTAIARDVIVLVPNDLIEGALSLGATRSQVIRKVVLPTSRTGLFGAVVLGTGRALGETVAMAFLLGGVTSASPLPTSFLSTGATLASEIANHFLEAVGQNSLLGVLNCLALVLMVFVGLVNLAARLIIARAERRLR